MPTSPDQTQELRDRINAAWAADDRQTADRLQAELHAHFARQADAFMASPEHAAWAAHMAGRP